jgi:hypothetical protein
MITWLLCSSAERAQAEQLLLLLPLLPRLSGAQSAVPWPSCSQSAWLIGKQQQRQISWVACHVKLGLK